MFSQNLLHGLFCWLFRWPFRRLVCVLLVAALAGSGLAVVSSAGPLGRPGLRLPLKSGRVVRTAFVHLPRPHKAGVPCPLVLAFHGHGDTAAGIAALSGFNRLADKHGFIVVYPEGMARHWNDGRMAVGPDGKALVDDVAFANALIDKVTHKWRVDPRRIYAVGFSNGGLFCQRLGLELSGRLAAVASVSASMSEEKLRRAGESPPISVVMFFGRKDPIEPFEGGEVKFAGKSYGRIASIRSVVNFWVQHNACSLPGKPLDVSDGGTKKEDTVEGELYSDGKAGTEVLLYLVQGGGHTWPGTDSVAPESVVGKTCRSVSASQLIWDFFKQHAKQ
jgi:polyhydroxybutyrate depolymerase